MNKWQKLIWLVPIVALVIAAVPSFTDFNAAHFSTAGNQVSLLAPPDVTMADLVSGTNSAQAAATNSSKTYSDTLFGNALTNNETRSVLLLGTSNYMTQVGIDGLTVNTNSIVSTAAKTVIQHGSANTLVVTNGRVGVLTASPNYHFDVNGTINAQNGVNVGTDYYLQFVGRTRFYSPADGTLRITSSGILDRFFIQGPVEPLTDETATPIFRINSRTNSFCGGTIDYAVFCQDATPDSQVLSGIVTYAAANTNGVWYSVVTEAAANQAKAATAGTLTVTWSAAGATGVGDYATTNLALTITPDTSLTPAANKFYILWQIRNNGTNAITAL